MSKLPQCSRYNLLQWVGLSLFLFLILLLQGCVQQEPPLKVGTNIWPGYESLYVAREKGLLEPELVSLVEKVNATQVLRAFKSGQIDVAALTMDEALTLMASGDELRIITVMDFSQGADVLIVKPEIRQLTDLVGKTLLVEKTAVGAIVLQSALDKAGVKNHEVSVRNAGVNQHPEIWPENAIAGAVTFEPFKSVLTASGGHVLFDSSEIPRRIMDVMVVKAETAETRPDQLRHLLKAHFSAISYMVANKAEAAEVMSERLGLPADQVWQSFDGLYIPDLEENRALLSPDSGFIDEIGELKDLMREAGLIASDIMISEALLAGDLLPTEEVE